RRQHRDAALGESKRRVAFASPRQPARLAARHHESTLRDVGFARGAARRRWASVLALRTRATLIYNWRIAAVDMLGAIALAACRLSIAKTRKVMTAAATIARNATLSTTRKSGTRGGGRYASAWASAELGPLIGGGTDGRASAWSAVN